MKNNFIWENLGACVVCMSAYVNICSFELATLVLIRLPLPVRAKPM